MGFTVEPGFSIPPKKKTYTTNFIYPFKKMAIGDSFSIHLEPEEFNIRPGKKTSKAEYIIDKVRRKAQQYRRLDPTFYILIREMNMAEHHEVGVRVWRIKKVNINEPN